MNFFLLTNTRNRCQEHEQCKYTEAQLAHASIPFSICKNKVFSLSNSHPWLVVVAKVKLYPHSDQRMWLYWLQYLSVDYTTWLRTSKRCTVFTTHRKSHWLCRVAGFLKNWQNVFGLIVTSWMSSVYNQLISFPLYIISHFNVAVCIHKKHLYVTQLFVWLVTLYIYLTVLSIYGPIHFQLHYSVATRWYAI